MPTRVVILGGGFGGVYAALGLDHLPPEECEVTLIDRNNFFLFTPMLSEVAASSIDTRHAVNPIRRLFRRVQFKEAEIRSVDFQSKVVSARLVTGEDRNIPYDYLVVALGSVINYFKIPGVEEYSLPLKTLADAIVIRNRVIERLEQADVCGRAGRLPRLTFVVAGGGLAGVELAGDLNDYVRDAAKAYRNVPPDEIRVVLVEAGKRLMPELGAGLGDFARRKLTERGVEVCLNAPVQSATHDSVTIGGVGVIPTQNLIWTAGVAPSPFTQMLNIPLERGRIPTDEYLRTTAHPDVWAIGDVALIPTGRGGGFHPPTAQHAMREGTHAAANIIRTERGEALEPFDYTTLGSLATVGLRAGVGEVLGVFRVSGLLAWLMWRSYYLWRLPRMEKRVRVLMDWSLDMLFPRDIVELKVVLSGGMPEDAGFTAEPAESPAESRTISQAG